MQRSTLSALVTLAAVVGIAALIAVVVSNQSPGFRSEVSPDDPDPETGSLRFSAPTDVDGFLKKYTVDQAEQRLALCNDGSPSIYYHRPGIDDGRNKWIIHLKGGGSCKTPEECLLRAKQAPKLVSSEAYGDHIRSGGIQSKDEEKNPEFHNWNQVWIAYCSSDGWIGDNYWEQGNIAFQFRGHNIITAVMEDLQDTTLHPGASLLDATHVLFTGSSAGGGGLSKNLDRVAEMLSWADVKGVIDGAWGMQYVFEPYQQLREPRATEFTIEDFQNPQPDESCMAAYPVDQQFLCRTAQVAAEHLETPFFLYVDQNDPKIWENLGITDPEDPDQAHYLEELAAAVRLSVADLDAVFSSRDMFHTGLTHGGYFEMEVLDYTYQDVLTNWYFDREGPTIVIEPQ